jgi:hypothetical protein
MARPVLLLIACAIIPQVYDGPISCAYLCEGFSKIRFALPVKVQTGQFTKWLAGRADWVFSTFVQLQFDIWACSSEKPVGLWSEA